MYESKNDDLLSSRQFMLRLVRHVLLAILIIGIAMCIGVAGHMWFEAVNWHDAMLNVSLILAGIGPFLLPESTSGKLFFAFYNILVGLVFVALIGVVMAPVMHRVLHKFHVDDDD